jgi:shikimate dehydrogenase
MRFVLLGDPVAHSRSPAMHAAAYRALGLDHTYEAVRVGPDELGAWVEKLRRGEVAGINVTVPHKRAALAFADEVDEVARACDACNVLALRDGRVVAYDTDVPALALELRDGRTEGGGTAIVLGSGGAARAAVAALRALGAAKIVTRARRVGASERRRDQDADEPLAPTGSERGARWIVQATSAGMTGADPGEAVAGAVRFDLAPDALALDVVYEPPETPFLAAARAAGLRAKNGLGMLARQGALAFEIWLGRPAPLEAMRAALGA